jgi:hypothetical protein
MDRPKGHGDYGEILGAYSTADLFAAAEAVSKILHDPGFKALEKLLSEREQKLVTRLVRTPPSWEGILGREQVIGMIDGLQQLGRASDSLLYAAADRREQLEQADESAGEEK